MLQLYGTHEKIATQCEDLLFAIAISGWCTLNKCLSVHKNVNHFKNVLEDDVNSLYIFSILLLMCSYDYRNISSIKIFAME